MDITHYLNKFIDRDLTISLAGGFRFITGDFRFIDGFEYSIGFWVLEKDSPISGALYSMHNHEVSLNASDYVYEPLDNNLCLLLYHLFVC